MDLNCREILQLCLPWAFGHLGPLFWAKEIEVCEPSGSYRDQVLRGLRVELKPWKKESFPKVYVRLANKNIEGFKAFVWGLTVFGGLWVER